MNHLSAFLITMLLATLALAGLAGPAPARAEGQAEQDKTLSPFFFIKSDDPETDRLPLKSTTASVHIAGVIADVTVTQVYKNEGQNTLEAVYVFPGSPGPRCTPCA